MSRRLKFGLVASSVAGQTMQLVGSEDAVKAFQRFHDEEDVGEVLSAFDAVCEGLDLHPGRFPDFFPVLKFRLADNLSYRFTELWKYLEKRAKKGCYGLNKQCQELRVLVVGAGPCGLRTAIECQLLGARTVVVEEVQSFSRNTVLELEKWMLEDLKVIGVKRLFGRLGTGSQHHISTRVLQTALLKICCLLGVQVYTGVKFISLLEPEDEQGWHARLEPEDHEARHFSFDVVVGASGLSFCLEGFNRGRHTGESSLTVTASFKNEGSPEEALIAELPEINREVHSQFFEDLEKELKLQIERVTYLKDDTHFLKFDVNPEALVKKKILKENFECRNRLFSKSNVDTMKLKQEVLEVCRFTTRYHSRQLPHQNFAINSVGEPDICIHDFSNRFYSTESGRVVVRKGFPLLITLVGDSLANFPWNNGEGNTRGFLSCFDCAWMIRCWSLQANPLQVLSEREQLYTFLSNYSSAQLHTNIKKFSLDPWSRYVRVNMERGGEQQEVRDNVLRLYDTDNKEEFRYLSEKFMSRSYFDELVYANVVYRYKSTKQNSGGERGRNFKKIITKKTNRLKEVILLRFGKTEATRDPEFEAKMTQFRNQDIEVNRLNLTVFNYVTALNAVREAESDLFNSWATNIQDWHNLDSFLQNAADIKERRLCNLEHLNKEVVLPLKTFKIQFKEVKERVERCEELRVQADRLSFLLNTMQTSQKADKTELERVQMKQSRAEDAYQSVLEDLKAELPALYAIRREFFAQSLYSLFIQQNSFNSNLSYIYREMSEYVLIKLKSH